MEVTEQCDGTATYDCQVCGRQAFLLKRQAVESDGRSGSTPLPPVPTTVWLNVKVPPLCGACKKFYSRFKKANDVANENCNCKKNKLCKICRFQRCDEAVKSHSQATSNDNPSPLSSKDESDPVKENGKRFLGHIPCQVCGASSSGYHFGILTCEGCKGFFRRSIIAHTQYRCSRTDDNSEMHRQRCKLCRWNACLAAGMSRDAARTGRHSIKRKLETSLHLQSLAAENRLLTKKVYRRQPQPGTPAAEDSEDSFELPSLSISEENEFMPSATLSVERPLSIDIFGDTQYYIDDTSMTLLAESTQISVKIQMKKCDALTFDMTPGEVWTRITKSAFEPHSRMISEMLRAVPGFHEIQMPDRTKLFANAYFPILLAIQALDFDIKSRSLNYFGLPDYTSRRVFKSLLGCDQSDVNERQFTDAGYSMAEWNPNKLELGMLFGLMFFNADVNNLQDADTVREWHRRYELADEHYNQRFDDHGNASTRFSVMADFFVQMNQVIALGIENIRVNYPDLLNMHPLFGELYSLLSAPPLSFEFLRANNYHIPAMDVAVST